VAAIGEVNMASKNDSGLPFPRTPPGWKKSGNLLYDLNKMYGRTALNDPKVRARIRKESKGKVDVKEIDGEWRLVEKGVQPNPAL